MKHRLAAVDLDGVLFNIYDHTLYEIKKRYGIEIAPHKWSSYDILDSHIGREKVYAIFDDPEFLENLWPMPQMTRFIRCLRELVDEYVILTARPDKIAEPTKVSLKKHLGYVPHVVHTTEKAAWCEGQRVSIMFEDSMHHALACAEVCPVILPIWPINRHPRIKHHPNIHQVYSLDHATRTARHLLKWAEPVDKIEDKQKNYRLLHRGLFGNISPPFETLDDVLRHSETNDCTYGLRLRRRAPGGGAGFVMDVPAKALAARCDEYRRQGIKDSEMQFSVYWPEEAVKVKGVVTRAIGGASGPGYILEYTTVKKPWGEAFAEGQVSVQGLRALYLLREWFDPASYDDLMTLFDQYPDSVVEFSVLEEYGGTVPGRNVLIWEVRDY